MRETGKTRGRRRQVARETHRHSRTHTGRHAAILAQVMLAQLIQQAPLLLQFLGRDDYVTLCEALDVDELWLLIIE